MFQGMRLIDAHVHLARQSSMRLPSELWKFDSARTSRPVYHEGDGLPPLDRLDEYFDSEGVDTVLLMSEHSPRVTGFQPIDDLLPLAVHDAMRYRLVANLNPHVHYPVRRELARQLGLGAVALKIHPVHGNFPANTRELYPAYAMCEDRGIPVIFHTGTSNFPGATNRLGDPTLIEDVIRDFPDLSIVLAHGGRGWWYAAAAFLTLMRDNVWIDLAGLPPRNLPTYFRAFDLERLAGKWIFGSDWPGAPGIAHNAEGISTLGLSVETLTAVLGGNAARVYGLT